MKQHLRTKNIAIIGMLIALDIIFTRFWMIQTPQIRISLGFFAIAMIGMLYGPMIAGIAAGLSDIVGWFMHPYAPFFPGFTLTAIVTGVIFGYFLHKPHTPLRSYIFSAICVTLVCDTLLNTLWLSLIQNVPFISLIITRGIKIAVMFILYIAILPIVCEKIKLLVKTHVI
ncbi:folate family ECF transporter S component [Cellulosilyticum sp. I15G10I2]|uniref:folate family ECF transporter S component n=1 Tax=Cellulosilyticum sp. I15G10I2 TaxID=1892843 RepID=UPI00085C4D5A|nr:folate family ECF transporter S component [Cellulosilyticum sp. I15G10I2]